MVNSGGFFFDCCVICDNVFLNKVKKGPKMVDIPNTEYITVKRDENGAVGIFVGGKPATTYRGVEIAWIECLCEHFEAIQKMHPDIMEMHALSSETSGKYSMVGNPSPEHGRYAWCRVKNNDGKLGGWVFDGAHTSASDCASYCAYGCALNVRANAAFWRAVLVTAFDKQNVETNSAVKPENPEIEKLKAVDFSKLPKSPIELNGYEIIVKKIAKTK